MGEIKVTVKGTVAGIVFRNDDTGYTVLVLELIDGGKATCVGTFANLSVGAILTVNGHKVMHRQYGEQIVADSYTLNNPTSKDGIIKYLSSGLVKGVGGVTAQNIYDMFGEDTFGVIENNPMQLAKVKGISKKKAMEIANAVSSLKQMQEQIMFLQGYGMTTNLAMKIYNNYGPDTKRLVLANPYRLVDDIDGVGFLTADKIAVSMGVEPQSEFRLRAAIVYTLKDSAEKEGNTYLVLDDMLESCGKLLGIDLNDYTQLVEDTLTKLVLEPSIKTFDVDGRRCVAFIRYYKLESGIAAKLVALNHDVKRISVDADSLIAQFGTINKIKFHESQSGAVKAALVNGATVITGGPGTGKTTIIKCIGQILTSQGLRVLFCAPTGRASKRITQSTGFEAKTIHRMLGFEAVEDRMLFKYNRTNPLPCDAVIVDEMSMVDVSLFSALLRALRPGTRLVLVGDADQLPSVGAGNVFSDLIRSKKIETVFLREVFRQAEQSAIIRNAHRVNLGEPPELKGNQGDFFFLCRRDAQRAVSTVLELCRTRLPENMGIPAGQIQVLSPTRKGETGTVSLNRALQAALNPPSPGKRQKAWGDMVFRVGDRVMQTKNNYDVIWQKDSGEAGSGIFNGDVGTVEDIDPSGELVTIRFDDRVSVYTADLLGQLDMAYAMTVHKAQGSEYRAVVLVSAPAAPSLLVRGVLYTAITRARELLVMVGDDVIPGQMAENDRRTRRYSGLRRRLKQGGESHGHE